MNWHASHMLLIEVQRGRTSSQRDLFKEIVMKFYALAVALILSTPSFAAEVAIEMLKEMKWC